MSTLRDSSTSQQVNEANVVCYETLPILTQVLTALMLATYEDDLRRKQRFWKTFERSLYVFRYAFFPQVFSKRCRCKNDFQALFKFFLS